MNLAEVNLAIILIYGPVGCACAWIVLHSDRKTVNATREMVAEIRNLSHKINGLMRAHLISTLAQPRLDPKLKAYGETILANEDVADAQK